MSQFFINSNGGGGGGGITSITAEDGTVYNGPNVNIFGKNAGTVPVMYTEDDSGNFAIEDRTWITQYVVDGSTTEGLRGTFSTIQAALNQAQADGMNYTNQKLIYIRTGVYNENISIPPGAIITGQTATLPLGAIQLFNNTTRIVGNVTFSGFGVCTLKNIIFQAQTGNTFDGTGSAIVVASLENCFILNTGAGLLFANMPEQSSFQLYGCTMGGNTSGTIQIDTTAWTSCKMINCEFLGDTRIKNDTNMFIFNCINVPAIIYDTNGVATILGSSLQANGYTYNIDVTALTSVSTNIAILHNCNFAGATSAACSNATGLFTAYIYLAQNCQCTNGIPLFAISGLATMYASEQGNTLLPKFVVGDSNLDYRDSAVGVQSTGIPTSITIDPSNFVVGQTLYIYDLSGSGSAFPYTITATATTINNKPFVEINQSYGSLCLVYDGTQFTILSDGTAQDLHVAAIIVNPTKGVGNFTTLTDALAAATFGQTIFLMEGIYTEDCTLKSGVDIVSFIGEAADPQVTIIGKLTADFEGSCAITGMRLKTNGDYCINITGSDSCQIVVASCVINAFDHAAVNNDNSNSDSGFYCRNMFGSVGGEFGFFDNSCPGLLSLQTVQILNPANSTTNSTMSAGSLQYINCTMQVGTTTSGTAVWFVSNSHISKSGITNIVGTVQSNNFNNCTFFSGSQPCITVNGSLIISTCGLSSSTVAMDGSGSVTYGGLTFLLSNTITTTTQSLFVSSNDAISVINPSSYPFTTSPNNAVIAVDTSAARTIIPAANPNIGQKYIIKDATGGGVSFPITVAPSGKNIDGSSSKNIVTAYGSMTIVYTGTQFSIISEVT